MQDLIERLEKATGPDRSIEDDIALHVLGWTKKVTPYGDCGDWTEWIDDQGRTQNCPDCYTESIDAALTLVPDFLNRHWYAADSDAQSNGKPVAAVYHPSDIMKGGIPRSVGATPAIALCIAALKARLTESIGR